MRIKGLWRLPAGPANPRANIESHAPTAGGAAGLLSLVAVGPGVSCGPPSSTTSISGTGSGAAPLTRKLSGPRTIVVTWSKPFIDAHRLFSSVGLLAMPQPKHILQQAYQTRKADYDSLPFWTDEFVGLGPFKLKSFERDQFMVVTANDQYIM